MQTSILDVIRWPKVPISVSRWAAAAAQLKPLGVTGQPVHRHGYSHGQAVWGSLQADAPVGIAWDWAEVAPDVVVLADPMMIMSNLQLIDDDGQPLTPDERILALNAAIHGLPWQRSVVAATTAYAAV